MKTELSFPMSQSLVFGRRAPGHTQAQRLLMTGHYQFLQECDPSISRAVLGERALYLRSRLLQVAQDANGDLVTVRFDQTMPFMFTAVDQTTALCMLNAHNN